MTKLCRVSKKFTDYENWHRVIHFTPPLWTLQISPNKQGFNRLFFSVDWQMCSLKCNWVTITLLNESKIQLFVIKLTKLSRSVTAGGLRDLNSTAINNEKHMNTKFGNNWYHNFQISWYWSRKIQIGVSWGSFKFMRIFPTLPYSINFVSWTYRFNDRQRSDFLGMGNKTTLFLATSANVASIFVPVWVLTKRVN